MIIIKSCKMNFKAHIVWKNRLLIKLQEFKSLLTMLHLQWVIQKQYISNSVAHTRCFQSCVALQICKCSSYLQKQHIYNSKGLERVSPTIYQFLPRDICDLDYDILSSTRSD